ncbi:MarR family winged helix-turn-helix transcriptional regulator [Sciscionella marina]|uniref:MarR family winged helix-turn-helix transcriptional regulator n=1 Tax=Sciscionella marina TaxID=508770 RepID=UPI00036BBA0E|nr:MarR family transcriptional regulator [Sciscionella marina]
MAEISTEAAKAAQDLRVLFSRLRRRLLDSAATEDLNASQTSVLARLVKDGPSSASVLAGAERVRPQSMATTLTALEKHGLIERAPDPGDGRRQVITLTAAGRKQGHGARASREEWLARSIQERYTAAERATIIEAIALLDRVVQQ